ncbi:helix-turn-helix transcriptional regulator [Actinokineospora sp. NBRC 105648]|uniref:helix-turn-helix domain-containing protein n=1 Tax=Actinokineospora sp. NBRC 105648 TaxID=3032206 RepID=UPI0024A10732|nr:helix-turn-helix transcriptional regulator [Actinokineospora sp. NBRC 105648]GLZ39017.1 hypothetical protein Acsp05_26410 [Actinokineospora sp. NBRC 105648]
MGGNHKPGTPRDRALGAELRAIRENAGMSLAQTCEEIQWNPSHLSRLERGQRHISPESVMGLAMIYQVPADRRTELVARAKEVSTLGWWDRPPAGVPTELGALAAYEHEAIRMTDWSPSIIPGLLQTPAYAEALMREWGVPEKDLNARLGARRQRQGLLDRRQVDYTALIGDFALRNQLCEPEAFATQLRHVATLARRDGISIRLVEQPTALAMFGWYLMDFDQVGSAVLVEHHESSTFLFDEETTQYLRARRALTALALSERATQDRLQTEIERVLIGG